MLHWYSVRDGAVMQVPNANSNNGRRERSEVGSTSYSLLFRIKQNDAEAWDRLVDLYAPLVYYWCGNYGVAPQDRADVFQDVFQTVARSIGDARFDRPGDSFRGWLRTVTRSRVLDFFRRRGKQPDAIGGTEANLRLSQFPAAHGDVDDEEDQSQHILFLSALEMIRQHFEPRTWQAFWRVVVDGCAPKDVAEELDMRPGTVRVAKSRVLHRLREELGDDL